MCVSVFGRPSRGTLFPSHGLRSREFRWFQLKLVLLVLLYCTVVATVAIHTIVLVVHVVLPPGHSTDRGASAITLTACMNSYSVNGE